MPDSFEKKYLSTIDILLKLVFSPIKHHLITVFMNYFPRLILLESVIFFPILSYSQNPIGERDSYVGLGVGIFSQGIEVSMPFSAGEGFIFEPYGQLHWENAPLSSMDGQLNVGARIQYFPDETSGLYFGPGFGVHIINDNGPNNEPKLPAMLFAEVGYMPPVKSIVYVQFSIQGGITSFGNGFAGAGIRINFGRGLGFWAAILEGIIEDPYDPYDYPYNDPYYRRNVRSKRSRFR